MKILSITAQKPSSTGSGVYLTELVRQLHLAGHQQAVVGGVYKDDCITFPDDVRFYPVFFNTKALPFPIAGMSDEMPYQSTRYCDMTAEMTSMFKAAFLDVISRAVNDLKPDLILCHHLYLLAATVREAFPDIKVFGFCHSTDLRQLRKHGLEKDFILSQIPKLDHIFVPQSAQKQGVIEIFKVPETLITSAGMGYNSDIFYPSDNRQKDGVTRLIFAGKIAEKKGLFSLLRALRLLTFEPDRLEVYLAGGAGNTEEYEAIRALAETCPYPVIFTGRLDQKTLASYYNRCSIFVLPSFFEGIPLTVIEALACGCSVVMTSIPGIPEWLGEQVPDAPVRFVELPKMKNTDEPLAEELPAFEKRLAEALRQAILSDDLPKADVSHLSWADLTRKVLSFI